MAAVLILTQHDGTGDAIVCWYHDWSRLSADVVEQGTVLDDTLLHPPASEPWQDPRPYLIAGPDVEWRTVEKHEDDPAHVFRAVAEMQPAVLGVEAWVAPTGSHDAPGIGDHRYHDEKVWRSTIVGNTVEPGTHPGFDWWVEVEPPAVPDRLRQPLAVLRPQVVEAATVEQVRDALLAVLDVLIGT